MTKDAPLSLALAAATALAFFAAGAPLVGLTDLLHDEAVHGQMALDWMSPAPEEDAAAWPWPWWMKDTYQGSLKTIALTGAFRTLGASTKTLRVATLAIGALSVFFLILFAARRHRPSWAALIAPLVATSPGLVLATCYDSGPVALGLLLRSAGICFAGEAIRRPGSLGWPLAAGTALGAGVWDKAHFLWLLLAAAPAAAVLWRSARAQAPDARRTAALCAGILLGAWPIVYFNIRFPLYTFFYSGARPEPIVEHLSRLPHWVAVRAEMAAGALTGTSPFRFSGGSPPAPWAAAAVPLLAAAALAVLLKRKRRDELREPAFWTLLIAGVLAIAFLAPFPVKWHHFPLIAGLPALAALSLVRGAFGPSPSRGARLALGSVVVVAALGQLSFLSSFRASAAPGARDASRGLSVLAAWAGDYQRRFPGTRFLCDDSLIGPLLVHSGAEVRCAALHGFTRTGAAESRARELFADGRVVWLLPATEDASQDPFIARREKIMRDFASALPTMEIASFPSAHGGPWVSARRAATIGRPALDAAWSKAAGRMVVARSAEFWLERAEREARSRDRAAARSSLAAAETSGPDPQQRRRVSSLYRTLKEPRKAAAALEPLLRLAPGDAGLLIDLAELRAELGADPAALELLARARQPGLDPGARRRAAALYRSMKEYAQAVASLEPLRGTAFGDGGVELELAELQALLGENDAARASLARAERATLGFEQRRRAYALHRRLDDLDGAAAALEALARLRPTDGGLWLELSELAAATGGPDAARGFLSRADRLPLNAEQRRRAYELHSKLGDRRGALAALKALMGAGAADVELWLKRAELETQEGDAAAALASLERAARLRPAGEQRRRVIRLFGAARAPRRAADALAPLVEEAPGDAELLLAVSDFRSGAGERAPALDSLARARALPLDETQRLRVLWLYRDMKEYGLASEVLSEMLHRAPEDAGLWVERAELESAAGSPASARDALVRAEALAARDDPDGRLRRRVALAHQALGDYRRAVALLDALSRSFPGDGVLLADKGLCEHLSGDSAAAIATLENAIRLAPKSIPAYLTLGAIHAALGRPEEALKVYDAGLALDPAPQDATLRDALLGARAAAKSAR